MDHWWFLKWENQGDAALRYFLEPAVLTVNYAKAHGYDWIGMAGLSGGGWSTTFASAIDKRINASFPIAGSTPCGLRNPVGQVPGQVWTGGVNTACQPFLAGLCFHIDALLCVAGRGGLRAELQSQP